MKIKMIWGDGLITTCPNGSWLLMGTCDKGKIESTYSKLVDLFGAPNGKHGYYADTEWIVTTPVGIAAIYDGKLSDSRHSGGNGASWEELREWSVAGHNRKVVRLVEQAIQK